jgi:hypothetical protein
VIFNSVTYLRAFLVGVWVELGSSITFFSNVKHKHVHIPPSLNFSRIQWKGWLSKGLSWRKLCPSVVKEYEEVDTTRARGWLCFDDDGRIASNWIWIPVNCHIPLKKLYYCVTLNCNTHEVEMISVAKLVEFHMEITIRHSGWTRHHSLRYVLVWILMLLKAMEFLAHPSADLGEPH